MRRVLLLQLGELGLGVRLAATERAARLVRLRARARARVRIKVRVRVRVRVRGDDQTVKAIPRRV